MLAAELDDQRGPRAFVHEPGGFEPILQQQDGETFLCVNDHLGMPKDLVSADGLVVWTAAHSAYGRVIAVDADLAAKARYGESASGTAGARGSATGIESPFRLLGQVADEDAELGWTRFRCFDAETGRWLSPDPIGLDGGLNLFFAEGAPTDVVDPLGLSGNPHQKVFLDENVYFMEDDLKKAGFDVHKVPSGMKDPDVRVLVESQGGTLVTRNYKDFKGMQNVVRVSGTNPLSEQTATTTTSLTQIRDNPGLLKTSGGQAPASGFNKGHFKQLKDDDT